MNKKLIMLTAILFVGMVAMAPSAQAWWIFPSMDEVDNWWDSIWSNTPTGTMGHTDEIKIDRGSYEEIQKRTIVGFFKVFEEKYHPKKCIYNESIKKESCSPAWVQWVNNPDKKGDAAYSYETTGIKVNGKEIAFDDKGCEVCGDKLICWDKRDGWSPNRAPEFKCICRSGESCIEYNLSSNEVLYSKSDLGGISIEAS